MSIYYTCLLGTVWIVDLNCMTNQWCSVRLILIIFDWSEFMPLPRTQSKLSNPATSRSSANWVERACVHFLAGVLLSSLRLQVAESQGSCPICPSKPFITFWKPRIPGHIGTTGTWWGLHLVSPIASNICISKRPRRGKTKDGRRRPKTTREEDARIVRTQLSSSRRSSAFGSKIQTSQRN